MSVVQKFVPGGSLRDIIYKVSFQKDAFHYRQEHVVLHKI